MDTTDSGETKREDDSGGQTHHRVIAFFVEYWWLLTALVIAGHLVAWGVGNPETTKVNWVFFTTDSSIGVVIAVAVILGAIFAVLITQQRARGTTVSRRVRSTPKFRDITGSGSEH